MSITEKKGGYETPEMKVALLEADNFLCQSTGATTILDWVEDDVPIKGIWE